MSFDPQSDLGWLATAYARLFVFGRARQFNVYRIHLCGSDDRIQRLYTAGSIW